MAELKAPVTSHDHIRGSGRSLVTLVEYGDYECPHCGAAHPVVKQLLQHFGDRLRLVYRHFPLTEIHPHAGPAAETAEFAGTYNLFWETHDSLYANQHRLSMPLLFALVAALNLSETALREALTSGRYLPKIQEDFMGGVRSGVNGTPTFFVNGQRHDGGYSYRDLAFAIDTAMAHARAL